MEWIKWFAARDALWFTFLAPCLILLAATYLLFRQWLRRKRRVWYLPLAFLTAIIGIALGWPATIGFVSDYDRFTLAMQLGVPPSNSDEARHFPLDSRLAGMTSKPTTEEEVHELLGSAKLRYECHSSDKWGQLTNNLAEKYLFYSKNYYSPRVEVINVFYNSDGFVTKVTGIESADGLPLEDCSLP